MKKFSFYSLVSLLLLVLVGCASDTSKPASTSDENQNNTESNATRIGILQEYNFEEPSSNLIVADNGPVVATRGGYSWAYVQENGETLSTISDSASPHELGVENATPLTIKESIAVQFDFDPSTYDVIVWSEDGENRTYNSLASIEERGKYVVEILATFNQGTVSYLYAFDLK